MWNLFSEHLSSRLQQIGNHLTQWNKDALIIESGSLHYHFADDLFYHFKEYPFFRYLCPAKGHGHFLVIKPGEQPHLFYYAPPDFWHDQKDRPEDGWPSFFKITTYKDKKELPALLFPGMESAYSIGDQLHLYPDLVEKIGPSQLAALHWLRIQKTPYEIHCLKKANEQASLGHRAAEKAFYNGQTEKNISLAYVQACGQFPQELPYSPIVALNEKAAVLHYHGARPTAAPSHSLLIDAGAFYQGYGSDITRTYTLENQTHRIFKDLIKAVDTIQQELCLRVIPGTPYMDLHKLYCIKLCQLLVEMGVLKDTTVDEAFSTNLYSCFFPHGLGHPLGIQVHDVAGKQLEASGKMALPDERFPHLRTLRTIQNNDVLTVEPGLYFIPMLLEKEKGQPRRSQHFDWKLIESLVPFGGIRIEDNVVARHGGPENLTRHFLP